jgi:predicted nucleotidyltransferase
MAIRSPLHVAHGRPPEHPVVARLRERVLAAFDDRVERIVLFGSRARGDEHAESDWDFAVFFDHDPTDREERSLSDLTSALQHEFDTEIQSMARSGDAWLETDELSCNIRDHGRVVHGPAEIPMIERPVLQHARVALGKAERFAELSAGTPDDRFEGVIHGAYYAMFHAARGAAGG